MDKYVDNPGALDRLKSNPKFFFECPVTGIQMVRDPTWHWEIGTAEEDKQSSDLCATSDSSIKGIKAPRAPRADKGGQKEKPDAPLPKALLAKSQKALKDTLDKMQLVQTSLVVCTSDEGRKWVTDAVAESVQTHLQAVQESYVTLETYIAANQHSSKAAVEPTKDQMSKANDKLSEVYTVMEGARATSSHMCHSM